MGGDTSTRKQLAEIDVSIFSEFSASDLSVLAERLKADPAAARTYAILQRQAHEALRRLAHELMIKLAMPESVQNVSSIDWKRLAGMAREREMSARERRLLAQDLVIGTLVNIGNTGWDPFDPSTSADPSGGTLLALLDPDLMAPGENP